MPVSRGLAGGRRGCCPHLNTSDGNPDYRWTGMGFAGKRPDSRMKNGAGRIRGADCLVKAQR